jgi:hypothetical protein
MSSTQKKNVPSDPLRHCATAAHGMVKQKKCTGRPTAPVVARYRCFLPDLAGLAGLRRVGPGTRLILTLTNPHPKPPKHLTTLIHNRSTILIQLR